MPRSMVRIAGKTIGGLILISMVSYAQPSSANTVGVAPIYLTGLVSGGADGSGAGDNFIWNTLGNDAINDLYVAQNGSFLNSGDGSSASIDIALQTGLNTFQFYGDPGSYSSQSDFYLNAYLGSSPQVNPKLAPNISVYAPTQTTATVPSFSANASTASFALDGQSTAASGTSTFSNSSYVVSVSSFSVQSPSYTNVDKVGPFSVGPNGTQDVVGTLTLNVQALITPGSVNIANAGPTDVAYEAGTRSAPIGGGADTLTYKGLDILSGASFTLGVNETLDLNNGQGTLNVGQGGVFTGNGIIEGNVINAGLVRIPIESLAQVQGGNINVMVPTSGTPISYSTPLCMGCTGNSSAIYSFGGSGGGGLGGNGGGGGLPATPPAPVTVQAPSVSNQATFAVDSSLEVTGTYNQTSTGALRLFVGGNQGGTLGASKSGGTYSQLFVDQAATLDGTLEVVLQPELFSQFDYSPKVGDTFDFVMATGGLTLAPTLKFEAFVTAAGAAMLPGLGKTAYSSGIASDPDSLYELTSDPFSFSLIDNGTVLQGTLISPLDVTAQPVPLPAAAWLMLSGLGGLGVVARKKRAA